jgi:hypothetical protein
MRRAFGPEAELLVERVRVARVQHPAPFGIRAALDDLAHELDTQPAAAVCVEHVDVGEIHEARRAAVHGPREADLRAVLVEPDDVVAPLDQLVLAFARPAHPPVRDAAEIRVDRGAVEPPRVVVQLVAVSE